MPGGLPPARRAREGSRGTTLSPARPARTPGTGSSDKPLPDLATPLRPRPPPQPRALPVPVAEPAIPRSLPICRRRRRGSRWSARSEARTNDLEAPQDDGHTRPRGRPGTTDQATLDTKRHSFGTADWCVGVPPWQGADLGILYRCAAGTCLFRIDWGQVAPTLPAGVGRPQRILGPWWHEQDHSCSLQDHPAHNVPGTVRA